MAADGLRKGYGPVQAVRDVSFTVQPGEIFALLGPNGAGKTTTLEILEGFRAADAGRVSVLGIDPADRARGRELREQIGVVLQDIAVEPYLTVRETIARNAGYYPRPRDVDEVVGLAGLADASRRKVRRLSGGQKRRLDLALGVVGRPAAVPRRADHRLRPGRPAGAWAAIRALRDAGTTILLTTHYMEEAQELADRVAVMASGRIVAEGPPSRIGGRDTALTRISFALPDGCAAAGLPFMPACRSRRPAGRRQRTGHDRHGGTDRRAAPADRLGARAGRGAPSAHRRAPQPGEHLPAADRPDRAARR